VREPSTISLALASAALSDDNLLVASAIEGVLTLCERLGQLERLGYGAECVGAVAWLRGHYSHRETFRESDLAKLYAIPKQALQQGPVIFIAEVVATSPARAYNAVRKLRHLPGVEYWCGWRDRVRWAEGRVRRH
jgi:hypothetical protein